MARARSFAERALELDPDLPQAQRALGLVALFLDQDLDHAELLLRRALEIDPQDARSSYLLGFLLGLTGQNDEALERVQRAIELDPLSPLTLSYAARIYVQAGRRDEGVEILERALDLDPNHVVTLRLLGRERCGSGDTDAGLALLERARAQSDESLVLTELAYCHALAGDASRSRALLGELEGRSAEGYVSPVNRAVVRLGLGEEDVAMELLEEGAALHAPGVMYLKADSRFDPLADRADYADLLARIGLGPPGAG